MGEEREAMKVCISQAGLGREEQEKEEETGREVDKWVEREKKGGGIHLVSPTSLGSVG